MHVVAWHEFSDCQLRFVLHLLSGYFQEISIQKPCRRKEGKVDVNKKLEKRHSCRIRIQLTDL